ncbi:MAG: aminoacyl-tRNA hydrolase [Clostridiales bacterium]|jgi:PTH1 family peptidyl-tRNA hydrolase|nr:aminoacyl-tRNA hydrolase [Clostridiales bacterium]
MFFKNKSGGVEWLVVFLGNPGPKYSSTRHNVGFMAADALEKTENIKINKLRFNALTSIITINGEKILLMKPQTYMNLSGNAVAPAAAYYKVPAERVIVIGDDISLPVGKIRIRAKGSSGGHNGLKSIISALGTDNFPRIKVGVGAPPSNASEEDIINWVLGRFCGKDADTIAETCEKAAKAVSVIISDGMERAMNIFN